MTDDDSPHDPLRDRLRAADPAAGLPPPPDRWTTELAEAVMSADTDSDTSPIGTGRSRGPRRWLVPSALAAASVVAVLLVAEPLLRSGDDRGPSAAPPSVGSSSPQPTSQPTTQPTASGPLVLRTSGLQAGRCVAVSAESLRMMPTALEAVVLSVEGRDATLRVVRWWLGSAEQRAATTVVVRGTSPELTELVAGVRLRAGGRYLVTATSAGDVSACGFSAAWSPRLERLYAAAFGG